MYSNTLHIVPQLVHFHFQCQILYSHAVQLLPFLRRYLLSCLLSTCILREGKYEFKAVYICVVCIHAAKAGRSRRPSQKSSALVKVPSSLLMGFVSVCRHFPPPPQPRPGRKFQELKKLLTLLQRSGDPRSKSLHNRRPWVLVTLVLHKHLWGLFGLVLHKHLW